MELDTDGVGGRHDEMV